MRNCPLMSRTVSACDHPIRRRPPCHRQRRDCLATRFVPTPDDSPASPNARPILLVGLYTFAFAFVVRKVLAHFRQLVAGYFSFALSRLQLFL